MVKFSINEAKQIIVAFYRIFQKYGIKIPVLLNGGTGVGKTSMLQEVARELGLPLINLKLGFLPEIITAGIPKSEQNFFTLIPVKELRVACEQPTLLFLDELSLATDFKVAISLLFGGEVLSYSLHPQSYVISACNTGTDYDVNIIPKQVLARFSIVNLAYSIENIRFLTEKFEDFEDYLLSRAEEIVDIFNENDTNDILEPIACPRTLEYALWVLIAFKDGLIDDALKFKMLTTLQPQKMIKILSETPQEILDFVKIKSGIFEIKSDINGIISIIENKIANKKFQKFNTSEKLNIIKFVALCKEIKNDVKVGLLNKMVKALENDEKVKLFHSEFFKEIKKISKDFMA